MSATVLTAADDRGTRSLRPSRARARGGAVILFFGALTALMLYPLSAAPGSQLLHVGPDMRLYLWTIAWNHHALLHQPFALFDANIFHPARHSLAFSENLLGAALLVLPVRLVSDNPVLALNGAILLSCLLSGLGAYVLARQLGTGVGGALVAGVIFAFAPPRFFRSAQLHLTTVHWMPFCLTFLHRYLDGGARRHLLIALAFFTAQAVTSGHGALFLAIASGGLVVYHAGRSLDAWGRLVRDVGLRGLVIVALSAPVIWPYFQVRDASGLRRSIANARQWSPNAVSLIASPTHVHRAILERLPGRPDVDAARAYLFPGWLPLALAAIAAAGWRGRARFYALLALVTFWSSLGPRFGAYTLLYYLPGFDFIRVPSRLQILTLLCLAVLAAMGHDRIAAGLATARRRLSLTAVVLLVLAIEFAAFPLRTETYAPEITAADRWLAQRPRPFVVAEVPVFEPRSARASRPQSIYMVHSMAHWQPTVNGYSGHTPRQHRRLYEAMTRFPDEASVRALREAGVTHVVVHLDIYRPRARAEVQERLKAWEGPLTLEFSDGSDRVYSLAAGP